MARPKIIHIPEVLRKLFPDKKIRDDAKETGAVVRQRKVDIVDFFWTIILGFGIGRRRTIAGLRRSYEKTTGQSIEESSFYDRFNKGFVRLLRKAVADALKKAMETSHKLHGPFKAFRDVVISDSTVMRLRDLLASAFPACRTNHTLAALKMHAVLSVWGSGGQSVKITSERQHDGPVLKVGQWVRGKLLIFDLGYFRYQLFACITRNMGYFLSRLKGHANPRIVAVNRAYGTGAIDVVGEKLRDVIDRMKRDVLDVMVKVSFERRRYCGHVSRDTQLLRIVGIRDEKSGKYHLYVTNVPVGKLSAEDIRSVYAARWQVELLFKELKSNYRIDDLPSTKRQVVEALVYAAILTLIVSRRLLDEIRHTLPNMVDRLPEQRWAAIFVAVSQDVLLLMTRPPRETKLIVRLVSEMILREAVDPNCHRPTLLQAVETRRHAYRGKTA